jgi:hypothetical protein
MQSNSIIHHTVKPVVAGFFNIIIGSLGILTLLIICIGIVMFIPSGEEIFDDPVNLALYAPLIALPLGLLGMLSIIGGVYNLRRRIWGLALAGSIATAILTGWGVASVILTAMSRDEFA